MPVFFYSFAFICWASFAFGQGALPDSVQHLPEHNPKTATIFSAVMPGLGQAYNKKYWKIPILYAGFAALGYFIISNNEGYQTYKKASHAFLDNPKLKTYSVNNREYTLDNVLLIQDGYRRNRDLAIIFTTLVYVVNILDANVDAHLFYFDVSDNLSLRMQPASIPMGVGLIPAAGFNLTMQIK